MSLVPEYDSSENSSCSESNEDEPEIIRKSIKNPAEKLPTPGFIKNTENISVPAISVFTNPFIEEEKEKKAVLEKHVKMVNTKDNTDIINGKRICWNYRKGKCRFGHNCKYAHDSDLQKTKEQILEESQIKSSGVACQKLPEPTMEDLSEIKNDQAVNASKSRKRPGLSQGIIPGKKVMKKYMQQKK